MKSQTCDISILIGGKRAAKEFFHEGNTFIEGRPGSEFEIEVRNNTADRIMAIISVDGLSVINGTTASPDSPGYTLNAYQTIKIPGWKLSSQQAAKFTFSGKKDSYSQLSSNQTQNCGVIGVMCWSEKPKPVLQPLPPAFAGWAGMTNNSGLKYGSGIRGAVAGASGSAWDSGGALYSATTTVASTASINNLGTSFGEATDFETKATTFEKDKVLGVAVMYYDDVRGLKARGIVVEKPSRERYSDTPNPFPGTSCTPPSNWKG